MSTTRLAYVLALIIVGALALLGCGSKIEPTLAPNEVKQTTAAVLNQTPTTQPATVFTPTPDPIILVEKRMQLAYDYLLAEKYEEAIEEYRKVTKIDPDYALAHYNLGVAYYYQQQYSEAALAFQRAIEVDPQLLDDETLETLKAVVKAYLTDKYNRVLFDWCEDALIIQAGPSEDDLPELRKRLEHDPEDLEALYMLAIYDEQEGNHDDALKKWQKIVDISPTSFNYYQLGVMYQKVGMEDQAIVAHTKSNEADPFSYHTHNALGELYLARGFTSMSIAHYAWAYATCPSSQTEHILMAAKEVPMPDDPDSGQIAFVSDRDGNLEIYMMNIDGRGSTRLTTNPATDTRPAWSPDGRLIAFASDRDGDYEIYVMRVDGSGLTNLTDGSWIDSNPAWSPDGTKIAFVSNRDDPFGDIYVVDADGSNPINLTNNPAFDTDPAWSPDGRLIAFESDREGNQEIYVMRVDGSGLTNLTHNPAGDSSPAWSPDGTQIAFGSDRNHIFGDIFVMKVDGLGQTGLTYDQAGDVYPAWSPDGSWLVFDSDRDGNREIYMMSADGLTIIRLTDNLAADFSPAWRPRP